MKKSKNGSSSWTGRDLAYTFRRVIRIAVRETLEHFEFDGWPLMYRAILDSAVQDLRVELDVELQSALLGQGLKFRSPKQGPLEVVAPKKAKKAKKATK